MIIWIALAIPIPAAAAVYWRYHHRITLWEAGLMLGVPVLCVGLAKLVVETAQTSDTEFWGGWVTQAEYFEDWDERVSCRHEIPCSHPEYSTDEKGHRYQSGYIHSNDGHWHAYDVDYHPEKWSIDGSNGEGFSIDRGTFERLAAQFGNRVFRDLNRSYHSNDGDKYVATWKGEPERLEPVTTDHRYENRVQASSSIFNFPEIKDPGSLGLYDYPAIAGHSQRCVLGNAGPSSVEGERKLQYLNATLGSSKQFRVFVLAFHDRTMQVAFDQEAYWKRGNKNELVVCVGLDKDASAQWAYVFSWSESEALKIEARDFLMGQKTLDLVAFAEWLGPVVREKWVRKDFKDFSYLTVEPPTWAVVTTFFVTLAVSAGVAFWAVMNESDPVRVGLLDGLYEGKVRV